MNAEQALTAVLVAAVDSAQAVRDPVAYGGAVAVLRGIRGALAGTQFERALLAAHTDPVKAIEHVDNEGAIRWTPGRKWI